MTRPTLASRYGHVLVTGYLGSRTDGAVKRVEWQRGTVVRHVAVACGAKTCMFLRGVKQPPTNECPIHGFTDESHWTVLFTLTAQHWHVEPDFI
ncbi:hypothetical protein QYF36_010921 [Acer negundo]|nr:hypothetical protein QYF36_010921 [Acer negundo]